MTMLSDANAGGGPALSRRTFPQVRSSHEHYGGNEMTADMPTGRLLFIHAHPDDETLATGVAMAHYALAGHDVHLLTCTLGEEGEIIPPELRHLAADRDDKLGPYRRGELARATSRLGVTGHLLGVPSESPGPGPYRDSGMAGAASADRPDALASAAVPHVAAAVAEVIRTVRPDVVVTYDPSGGYGHPDHIAAYRATMAATAGMSDPAPKVFGVVTPRSWARADRDWVRRHVLARPGVVLPGADDPFPPSVLDDHADDRVVVGSPAALRARDDALRAHRTQVAVYEGYYTLSNLVAARLPAREAFRELDPQSGEWLETGASTPSGRPGTRGLLDEEEGESPCP